MKILMVVPSYIPAYHYGGPIRSVASLCEAMVTEGHSVRVFTTNANGQKRLKEKTDVIHMINGVEVIYFNRWTGDHTNFSPKLLWELWRNVAGFDAVHLHSWWNLVIMPSVMICLMRGVRPTLSPRGSINNYTFTHQKAWLKRWVHYLIGKPLLTKCKIHVTAEQEEKDVKLYLKNPALYIVPNLLDLKQQIKVEKRDCKKLHLIYLGRIDPKKNIEFLLQVVMKDFDVPFTLELVGEGDTAYVNSLKEKTQHNTSISWTGPVYDDHKWLKLASADILLLPSINENYGNVILEALSQGTAVVVSDNVGLKDYVLKNRLGWVNRLGKHEWRTILQNAWENQDELIHIRKTASACILRDFQLSDMVLKYIAVYSSTKYNFN